MANIEEKLTTSLSLAKSLRNNSYELFTECQRVSFCTDI